VGHEEEKPFGFSSFYCLLYPLHKRISMFAVLRSDINALKSGLLHLTGQPCCKKRRSATVKDRIINLVLRNYLIGAGKTTSLLSASFRYGNLYIWQAILT
jgi:hypothetical protein